MMTSLTGMPGTVLHDARLAVLLPVAQQQHLRRERRVAVDQKIRRRQRRRATPCVRRRTIAVAPSIRTSESTFDEAVALAGGVERTSA